MKLSFLSGVNVCVFVCSFYIFEIYQLPFVSGVNVAFRSFSLFAFSFSTVKMCGCLHRRLGGDNASQHHQTGKSFRFRRACDARFPIICPLRMKK